MFDFIKKAVEAANDFINARFQEIRAWAKRNERAAALVFITSASVAVVAIGALFVSLIVIPLATLVIWAMRLLVLLAYLVQPLANVIAHLALMVAVPTYLVAFYAEELGLVDILKAAFVRRKKEEYYPEQVFELLNPAPERVTKKEHIEIINPVLVTPAPLDLSFYDRFGDFLDRYSVETQDLIKKTNAINAVAAQAVADAKKDIQEDVWFQTVYPTTEPEVKWSESFVLTVQTPVPTKADFPAIPETHRGLKRKALADLQDRCRRINAIAERYDSLSPIQWDESMSRQQLADKILKFYAQLS